jgi:hypothetical protein
MNTSLFSIISIGYFNVDDRICTVFLFNIEGNIPHFHIWDTKTSGTEFHTTIRIELPEYLHKGDELDEKNETQTDGVFEVKTKESKIYNNL